MCASEHDDPDLKERVEGDVVFRAMTFSVDPYQARRPYQNCKKLKGLNIKLTEIFLRGTVTVLILF